MQKQVLIPTVNAFATYSWPFGCDILQARNSAPQHYKNLKSFEGVVIDELVSKCKQIIAKLKDLR